METQLDSLQKFYARFVVNEIHSRDEERLFQK